MKSCLRKYSQNLVLPATTCFVHASRTFIKHFKKYEMLKNGMNGELSLKMSAFSGRLFSLGKCVASDGSISRFIFSWNYKSFFSETNKNYQTPRILTDTEH